MKRFLQVIAVIFGYFLVLGIFGAIGEDLIADDNVRMLDLVAALVLYTELVFFTLNFSINQKDPAQRDVASLGIRMFVVNGCTFASLCLMYYGVVYQIPFKNQALGQLVLLFLLLVGRICSFSSREQTQTVYVKEKITMKGKADMRKAMNDFMFDVVCAKGVDETAKQRLTKVQENLRFISPSINSEATRYDNQFCQIVDELQLLIGDATGNRDKINEEIDLLEKILMMRKKY